MNQSTPDIITKSNEWVEVYETTSIPQGAALTLYNKSCVEILFWVDATPPANDSSNGFPLSKGEPFEITASSGLIKLYLKGGGPVAVLRK